MKVTDELVRQFALSAPSQIPDWFKAVILVPSDVDMPAPSFQPVLDVFPEALHGGLTDVLTQVLVTPVVSADALVKLLSDRWRQASLKSLTDEKVIAALASFMVDVVRWRAAKGDASSQDHASVVEEKRARTAQWPWAWAEMVLGDRYGWEAVYAARPSAEEKEPAVDDQPLPVDLGGR